MNDSVESVPEQTVETVTPDAQNTTGYFSINSTDFCPRSHQLNTLPILLQTSSHPKEPFNQQPNATNEPAQLDVAVIGDLLTDWAFISREPPRPRFPSFRAWTRETATYLFAFPGGAWFSGHMIQGALGSPVFERTTTTHIRPTSNSPLMHVVLKGTLAFTKLSGNANNAMVGLLLDDAASHDQLDIVLENDDGTITAYDASDFRSLLIQLEDSNSTYPTQCELGAHSADLTIASDYDFPPGFFSPDQVQRHFELDSVSLPSHLFQFTYFIVSHAALKIRLYPRKSPFNSAMKQAVIHSNVRSFRLLPQSFRRGRIGFVPCGRARLLHFTNTLLRRASLDVGYGEVVAATMTIDHGKLNTAVENRQQGQQLPPRPSSDLLAPQLTYLNHRLEKFQFGVWSYSNPRDHLSAQHPGHLVHTLSQLKPFPRYKAQRRKDLMVYRRSEAHGIDGPEHGLPTILDHYDHSRYCNIGNRATHAHNHTEDQYLPARAWNHYKIATPSLVVIDDEGLGFAKRFDKWAPFLGTQALLSSITNNGPNQFSRDSSPECSRELQELRDYLSLTWIVIKASHWLAIKDSILLGFLKAVDALDRTILVVSGESLRTGLTRFPEQPGVKLSQNVSWERTVLDFERAMKDRELAPMRECGWVVVRLGLEGALLSFRDDKEERKGFLCFDPERIEGEYSEHSKLGEFPGLTTVLTSSLVRSIAPIIANAKSTPPPRFEMSECIKESLVPALNAVRRYFDLGYGPSHETIRKFERLHLPISQVFSRSRLVGCRNDGVHAFATIEIHKTTNNYEHWSILRNYIADDNSPPIKDYGSADSALASIKPSFDINGKQKGLIRKLVRSLWLGRAIVTHGVKRAFASVGHSFPFANFGKLFAVDRKELEGLRSVRKILTEYLDTDARRTPISIAVFGPPGSGKSFGVKQIAKGLLGDKLREFTFNLAQFTSFQEITKQLLKVRDAALDGEPPLVFFDEFDCFLGSEPLGWLKYFLAPMNDGLFQHEDAMLGVGRAIFVFAGGIAGCHDDFANPTFWARTFGHEHQNIFSVAKVRDFNSRLRGFLDVVGINPECYKTIEQERILQHGSSLKAGFVDDLFAGEGKEEDVAYIVRRAVLVRQMLEQISEKMVPTLIDTDGYIEIDSDVLDALLGTFGFKHGVRSLSAIFEMSAMHGERAVTKTVLPAPDQLLMHVDDSFYSILTRRLSHLESGLMRGAFWLLHGEYSDRADFDTVDVQQF